MSKFHPACSDYLGDLQELLLSNYMIMSDCVSLYPLPLHQSSFYLLQWQHAWPMTNQRDVAVMYNVLLVCANRSNVDIKGN